MARTATVEEDERDYTAYADKEPTGTMQAFADWVVDEVFGGEYPGTAKEEKAFRTGMRLGGTLRMEFQASEYWKTHDLNPRAPQNANGKATSPKSTRGKAKAVEVEDDEPETEAPAKTTRATGRRGAAAKPAATKPATRRGTAAKASATKTTRRGAAAAASTDGEAPY